jgi:hypothetical protein
VLILTYSLDILHDVHPCKLKSFCFLTFSCTSTIVDVVHVLLCLYNAQYCFVAYGYADDWNNKVDDHK